jgi:hypothetical protein
MKRVLVFSLLLGCHDSSTKGSVADAALDASDASPADALGLLRDVRAPDVAPIDDAQPSEDDRSMGCMPGAQGEDCGDDGDSADSTGDVTADVAPDGVACPGPSDGGDDAATIMGCSSGGCIDSNWAEWPMPNSSVDVAAGAPNRESYTINGDGTVTDDVTALMWQQASPSSAYTWADAQAYCTSLTLGGHGDWRLATYIEMISILDYAHDLPSIDPTAFPATAPTEFWSATPIASTPSNAWEIFFGGGDTGDAPMAEALFPRCVRGSPPVSSPALPMGRYTVANGTVYDTRTRLSWQQAVSSATHTWADAKSYCASLNLNGAGAWRLPTAKELMTIVDVTKPTAPPIDCAAFPGATATRFWSSTPFVGLTSVAWGVYFYLPYTTTFDVSSPNSVRCVR